MNAPRILLLTVLLGWTLLLHQGGTAWSATVIWAGCIALVALSHPSRLLAPGCLYLLLLGLFHLGLIVLVESGADVPDAPSWIVSPYVRPALSLFSAAAVAFTLGVCARLRDVVPEDDEPPLAPTPELVWVGGTVAALGAAMLWFGAFQLGVFSMSYDVYFQRSMTEDVRFFGFGLMLFPIGLLVAATGASARGLYVLGGALVAVMGPLFLFGFRGPLLVQVAAFLAVWASKERTTARRIAIVIAVLAVVLVPAVRIARNTVERDLSSGIRRIDPLAVVAETGGSLYPLTVTVERMQSGRERPWMGKSYLLSMKRILPNVSARWTPPSTRVLTPSSWATMHADTWAFEHGGGIGFSGVAEPYLNFGVAGLVVCFLLLGAMVQQWDRWLRRDPFRGAVGSASFGAVLWTVRNDSIELFRVVAITCMVVLAAWVVLRLQSRREVARAEGHA